MACEQATRRGGWANITDSMWLVQVFQGWYVADGLYNEVRDVLAPLCLLTQRSNVARHLHHHGYNHGRFWIHAFSR